MNHHTCFINTRLFLIGRPVIAVLIDSHIIPSSARCATCEVRNETCDGTKGPIGCRCCVQAGVQCVGHLTRNAKIPNPQRGGENSPLPSIDSSPDEIPNPGTIPSDSPNRTRALRSVGDGSAGTTTRGFGYLHWSANIRVPQLPTNGQSDSPSIHYERTPPRRY
ncbi:unnamed protein product [Rhizoctonia solani]|uniref:Zn(2)-C6 fungal-type domain-containing protein n=1 Tax=Rhizoctonia solani TaxID=456999 RepID=A0A8H3H1J3_9AGAM|nr:unnamed protein product [Rhizoctonia solani]